MKPFDPREVIQKAIASGQITVAPPMDIQPDTYKKRLSRLVPVKDRRYVHKLAKTSP